MWETWVWSLGWEGPLEKEMATYPSVLAWRIPWMEEPAKLRQIRTFSICSWKSWWNWKFLQQQQEKKKKKKWVWMQSEENILVLLNQVEQEPLMESKWKANAWRWMMYKRQDSLKGNWGLGCRNLYNQSWLQIRDEAYKWVRCLREKKTTPLNAGNKCSWIPEKTLPSPSVSTIEC